MQLRKSKPVKERLPDVINFFEVFELDSDLGVDELTSGLQSVHIALHCNALARSFAVQRGQLSLLQSRVQSSTTAKKCIKSISCGQVDRTSATETVDSSSIPGRVKPKTRDSFLA